ncbi:MAG: glycosyltransferase family 28 [Acidimicrobiia bacterium]|nr:glycosyltransferase family 28 [Acidimicrobiia bacterium]MDH4363154.1 glycosyltransferase family 28 [Acidimicrobiia bacterium]
MGERLLVVSSGGGHLTEAMHLVQSLDDVDAVHWATADHDQSQTLLAGQTVWPITAVGPRQLGRTLALVPRARRLIRRLRPTAVLSTGAAPALPFLVTAARMGIGAHYIESLTRIDGPSLTGRLMAAIPGVGCYTQHGDFGGRWRPIGSPFDNYRADLGPDRARSGGPGPGPDGDAPPLRRVVVTVGTLQEFPFRSLVAQVARILPADAEVLWQTGSTPVADLGIDGRHLVPIDEMRRAVAEADVVVGHAGCGTTLDVLAAGRVPVLVPRRAARGEHVDDHQVELARHLERRGLAVVAEAADLTVAHLRRAAAGTVEALGLSTSTLTARLSGALAGAGAGADGAAEPAVCGR